MTTVLPFLIRHKYFVVSAFVALLIVLGLAGSFGSTVEAEGLELTAGGKNSTVSGECMILNPRSVVCVPSETPKGSPLVSMYEDGSAKYANGSVYGSNGRFR